jgi:hypothetical protein
LRVADCTGIRYRLLLVGGRYFIRFRFTGAPGVVTEELATPTVISREIVVDASLGAERRR